ncbi:hypothetical protein ACW9YV_16750 (plasmid) [Paraburkholderia strydomiana]
MESLSIWLNANRAQADWLRRMYLKSLSEIVASQFFNLPQFADGSKLGELFTDGWQLDYRSPALRDIQGRCADALRYK